MQNAAALRNAVTSWCTRWRRPARIRLGAEVTDYTFELLFTYITNRRQSAAYMEQTILGHADEIYEQIMNFSQAVAKGDQSNTLPWCTDRSAPCYDQSIARVFASLLIPTVFHTLI